jgi:hypothetical protein
MNLETRMVAYIISGLVGVRYNKLPTKLLYRVASTVGPSYFLLNFVPRGIGVSARFHSSMHNLLMMFVAYFF